MTDEHEYQPSRVQVTTHISLEARQVLERAKADTKKSLGSLMDEAILVHFEEYKTEH